MSSGDWSADTSLSTLTANVGAGITIDGYVQITGGQSFTISGKMKNAGITFLDPDGHKVFPYFDNYFSGSEENVSLSGTLTDSGTYRLQVTSSIFGGGAPDNDAHYSGNYDLTFSVYPASAVPEPSTLTLLAIGSASWVGYGWRRRRRSTRE